MTKEKQIENGCFEMDVSAKVKVELKKNDIFNWLNDCNDPETLRYLGRAALRFAAAIENPDNDDFRSRA